MLNACTASWGMVAALLGGLIYIYVAMLIAGTAWYASKLQYQRKLYNTISPQGSDTCQ